MGRNESARTQCPTISPHHDERLIMYLKAFMKWQKEAKQNKMYKHCLWLEILISMTCLHHAFIARHCPCIKSKFTCNLSQLLIFFPAWATQSKCLFVFFFIVIDVLYDERKR